MVRGLRTGEGCVPAGCASPHQVNIVTLQMTTGLTATKGSRPYPAATTARARAGSSVRFHMEMRLERSKRCRPLKIPSAAFKAMKGKKTQRKPGGTRRRSGPPRLPERPVM